MCVWKSALSHKPFNCQWCGCRCRRRHQQRRDETIVRENTNKNAYQIKFSTYLGCCWDCVKGKRNEHKFSYNFFLCLNDGYIFYCVLSTMFLINAFPILNHCFRSAFLRFTLSLYVCVCVFWVSVLENLKNIVITASISNKSCVFFVFFFVLSSSE